MTPATILFVCTGNICRSPLAEAVAHRLLESHLRIADLAEVSLRTASAGTRALTDLPASAEMKMAAAEIDLGLEGHRSTPVEAEEVRSASLVFVMEQVQADWLSAHTGRSGELLGTADIEDPYGQDMGVYRRVRDEIVAAVQARLPEMAGLAVRT